MCVILMGLPISSALGECLDYSRSLRWVGGISTEGPIGDVAFAGGYVYATDVLWGLQIIDVHDPTHPSRVGQAAIADDANGIAIAGTLAYVAAASAGLQIYDVSVPSAPVRLGGVPTSDAFAVAVRGPRAYVADRTDGLVVINVSDPAAPQVTRVVAVPGGRPVDVALSGAFAFVAALDAGVAVISIVNPDVAFLAGGVDPPGSANGIAISGTYAYVGGGYGGLQVLDIADPTNPVLIGTAPARRYASGITVSGDHIYFGDESAGLEVADVSDPTSPRIVGSAKTGSYTFGVAVDGNYAYAACWHSGMQVIDVSVPVSPPLVGSVPLPEAAYDVAVDGNLVYVACDTEGLLIVDVGAPDAPRIVGSVDTPGNAQGVVVLGQYAYVADAWYGLQVIDVSDPTTPAIVGTARSAWSTQAIAVHDGMAYLGTQHGIDVVDVTDPTHPDLLYTEPPDDWISDIVISGTTMYVCSWGRWLYIGDIGGWAHPAIQLDGPVQRLALSGSHVLLVGGFPGLAVVDVSNPDAPQLEGVGGILDHGWDVVGSGDYAYVTTGGWLVVVDISDPSLPTLVGGTTSGGGGFAIDGSDEYLYLGGFESFNVAALHCPDEPTPILLAPMATSRADGILVSWTIPEGILLEGVQVERRTAGAGEEWTGVSPLMPAESSEGNYLDRTVEPGVLYEYAVEAFDSHGPVGRYGPVSARATPLAGARLRAWPNPGRGWLNLSVTLPRSGDGLLRLFDSQGREVARKELTGQEAGTRQLRWDVSGSKGRALPAGAYMLRLDVPGGSDTAKWFVVD
jgi:hypothetical protein